MVAIRVDAPGGHLDLPWSGVRTLAIGRLEVRVAGVPGEGVAHRATSLAAGVLDHELIDPDGTRVVRVGDVVLGPTRDGLAAVGIEVGGAAVIRRIGPRRLARRCRPNLVPIPAIHVPSGIHEPLTIGTTTPPASHRSRRTSSRACSTGCSTRWPERCWRRSSPDTRNAPAVTSAAATPSGGRGAG